MLFRLYCTNHLIASYLQGPLLPDNGIQGKCKQPGIVMEEGDEATHGARLTAGERIRHTTLHLAALGSVISTSSAAINVNATTQLLIPRQLISESRDLILVTPPPPAAKTPKANSCRERRAPKSRHPRDSLTTVRRFGPAFADHC